MIEPPVSCVNGDALRGLCDQIFWSNDSPRPDSGFRHGEVVFCKIDEAWRFLGAARRQRSRVVLVTGEGDQPVDQLLWNHKPPQVVHWFGTNMFVESPGAEAIPLGLGNAQGKKTLSWESICSASASSPQRTGLLYANFSAHSNGAVRGPLLEWLGLPAQSWVTRESHDGGKSNYLDQLLSHHFVLCPPGNGEDTHRLWESLYCGAIPVVRRSPAIAAFRDLPMLIVDDLRSITPETLEGYLVQRPASRIDQLRLSYWSERIAVARRLAADTPRVTLAGWMSAWLRELQVVVKVRR